jgi:hypothetical protein
MSRPLLYSLTAILSCAAVPAHAADGAKDAAVDASAEEGTPIVVVGEHVKYGVK